MKIHAIQTGTVEIKKNQKIGKGSGVGRLINMLFGREWIEPALPIYAWVIEHPEGIILVDTGETARTAETGYFPRWHPYYNLAVRFHVKPEDEIGAQLRKMGINPKDVKKVILTHLHTDHAGGLSHFPESKIYVNLPEYQRTNGFQGQVDGYLPQHLPRWLEPIPIEFNDELLGGFTKVWRATTKGDIKVVQTYGHTPAHVSVIVESEDVQYFLAGDASYSEQNLLHKTADGVSPSPKQAIATMQKILALAKQRPLVYLPTHEFDSAVRLNNKTILSV
ncbi:MAG: N-acyl homoserine lactonase family protein [Anaerolineales bacterium]|nr:N-acyl homoserine lactonase family protein [Anaerolineales bacterium]